MKDRVFNVIKGKGPSALQPLRVLAFNGGAALLMHALAYGQISPPARYSHRMAFDSWRNQMVLFGGIPEHSLRTNDTWVWVGPNWELKSPSIVPSPRANYSLAYDSARATVVLFGGDTTVGLNDETWLWNGLSWSRFEGDGPSVRAGQAMVYDESRREIVLFGGRGTQGILGDTWIWNGTSWTQRTGILSPSARHNHAMAYDAARQQTVLFSGEGAPNDTWIWNGTNWFLTAPSDAPSARFEMEAIYDAAHREVVLFGGRPSDDTVGRTLDDTWTWDGFNWTRRFPALKPSSRRLYAAAYDPLRQEVVLEGGYNSILLNDTYVWDGFSWRLWTNACFAAPSGLLAWWSGNDSANDELGLNNASLVNGVGFSGGRVGSAFSFDGVNDVVVIPDATTFHFGTGDLTVDAWIKTPPMQSGGTRTVLGKNQSSGGHGGIFFWVENSLVKFAVTDCGTGDCGWGTSRQAVVSPGGVDDGLWHHIAGVRAAQGYSLFIDGQLVATRIESARDGDSASALCIGAQTTAAGNPYLGSIDELAIYGRALSSNEIASIYAAGSAGKCTPSNSCIVPPSGLVSWWTGEGNPYDQAGANHGTLQNGTTFGAGIVGQAFSFDGVDDVVQASRINLGQAYSVEFWMNPAAYPSPSGGPLVANNWTSQSFGTMYLQANGRVNYWQNSDPKVTSVTAAALNKWTHVALTHDGAVSRLYLNGLLEATSLAYAATFDNSLTFGREEFRVYRGRLDEISIYNRVLGGIEIQAIYAAGSAGKCKPQCVPAPSGLVSWWRGDESAKDLFGSNNGARVNGSAYAPAKVGLGFSLDGNDDYVEVPHNASLNLAQFSVEAWALIDPAVLANRAGILVAKGDTSSCSNGFWIGYIDRPSDPSDRQTNSLHFGVYGGCGIVSGVAPANAFTTAAFYHIAGTFDGSVARLYLNGNLVGTGAPIEGMTFNNLPLRIGAAYDSRSPGFNYPFRGVIDECSLYSRALSPSEIAAIYAAGGVGKCEPEIPCVSPPSGLVGWWPGEGSAGDLVGSDDGSLRNKVTFGPGKVGQAFSLDGAGFVEIADSPRVSLTNSVTLSAWIKADSVSSFHTILSQYDSFEGGKNQSWNLAIQPGGILRFGVYGTSGADFVVDTASQVIQVGRFTHVLGTFDLPTQTIKVYIDSVEVPTIIAEKIGVVSSIYDSATPIWIGAIRAGFFGGFGAFFRGLIDEAQIYNRALSANEIAAIYVAGSAGLCVTNQPIQYRSLAVATSPATAGSATGGGTFQLNSQVTVIATPSTNGSPYFFVNWTENGVPLSTNNPYSFILSQSRQLVANFDLPAYSVIGSNNPASGGSILGAGLYRYGSEAVLTAVPNFGYRFTGWMEGNSLVGTNQILNTVVVSNRFVIANFAEANLLHAVTISPLPSLLLPIPGSGAYSNGTSVTISAPPVQTNGPSRYTFVRWTLNGTNYTTNSSFTKTFSTTDATNLNFLALYEGKSIRPLVVSVATSTNNPVAATTNFVVTIQFDRSMNIAVEPQLTFTNSASASQATVPSGGLWTTTTFSNDSYRTPAITFMPGADGVNRLFASLAQGLDGVELASTNVVNVIVDTIPPIISGVSSNLAPLSAVISWITDEPATTHVEYGADTNYGRSTGTNEFLTSHSITLNDLLPGSPYHFRVHSRDRAGNEAISTDGSFTTPLAPDLVVTNLNISPASIQSGTELTISWIDLNVGPGPTTNSWDDQLIISNSTTGQRLLSTTVFYDSAVRGNIVGGASRSNSARARIPDGFSGVGTLEVLVSVDANNTVTEYNAFGLGELNNTAGVTRTSTLASYPDLAVASVFAPSNGLPGQQVQLMWTVTNQGFADSVGVRTDAVSLSTDPLIGGDQPLQSFDLGRTILAGQSLTVTQSVILPSGVVGNVYFVVAVNSGNRVFELVTTNNAGISATPLTALNPDLIVQSVSSPASAQLGQSISMSWIVQNIGAAGATVNWSDLLYLSTSSNSIAGADVLTTQPAVRTLTAGAGYTNTQSVLLPFNSSRLPGNYFVLVAADYSGVLPEWDPLESTCRHASLSIL